MWGWSKMRGRGFGKVKNFRWFSGSSGEEVEREKKM